MYHQKWHDPALYNLKIKHCNPLVYRELAYELGCINLYNTTVAEQKNVALKTHVMGRCSFVNILVTLKKHLHTEERATVEIVSMACDLGTLQSLFINVSLQVENKHIGNMSIMRDTVRVTLPQPVRDQLKKCEGSDICSHLSIEEIQHRVGQAITYFPLEDIGCTNYQFAIIAAIVANSDNEAHFVAYAAKSTPNELYQCHVIEATDEILIIHSKQLASHLPSNLIETSLGKVVCFQSTPIKFQ